MSSTAVAHPISGSGPLTVGALDVPAEEALLLRALRSALGAPDGAHATAEHRSAGLLGEEATSAAEIDADGLLRVARDHGVVPLLHRGLSTCGMAVRDDVVRRVARAAEARLRRGLLSSAELARVAVALTERGVRFVSLKGPALSMDLWGDVATRAGGDLDLLVAPDDVDRALLVLEDLGYDREAWSDPSTNSAAARRMSGAPECELSLPHRSLPVEVDVHWRLQRDACRAWATTEAMLARRRAVVIGAVEVPVLDRADALLFTAAHGTKHAWDRLGWIVDFARGCELELDSGEVVARARDARLVRSLAVGAELSRRLFGVDLSSRLALPAESGGAVAELADRVVGRLRESRRPHSRRRVRAADDFDDALALFRFRLDAAEGLRHKWTEVRTHLLRARSSDRRDVPLPRALEWLHAVLRPLRLGARLLRRGLHRSTPARRAPGKGAA